VVDRCLFRTEKGYIGLCPAGTRPGDEVVVLTGCSAPVILHEQKYSIFAGQQYITPGHCYVNGIMAGEAMGFGLPKKRIRIV
jgi:hypothetical protein